jgi:hypothetical protein
MPDLKNPFLDFSFVPESMRDELKCAMKENNVAFELNPCMLRGLPESFINDYLGWAADLQNSGITLAFGSDCHSASLTRLDYEKMNDLITHYGIDPSKFFVLKK